jgi:hypothetical protein
MTWHEALLVFCSLLRISGDYIQTFKQPKGTCNMVRCVLLVVEKGISHRRMFDINVLIKLLIKEQKKLIKIMRKFFLH